MSMFDAQEKIKGRYKERAKEADVFGRIITVRRLRPSEQSMLAGMTDDLEGSTEIDETAEETDPETGKTVIRKTGRKTQLQHRTPLMIAAAVCELDGHHLPFPKNRGELNSIYDALDVEGITAAGKALAKLGQGDDAPPADTVDAAKNSMGTPSSV